MFSGLYEPLRESLDAFHQLEHIFPINSKTLSKDADQVKRNLAELIQIVQNLATRKGRKRSREEIGGEGREEELRRLDWLDGEGVRLWNLAVSGAAKTAAQDDEIEDREATALPAAQINSIDELLVTGSRQKLPSPETRLGAQRQMDELLAFSLARIDVALAHGKVDSAFTFIRTALEWNGEGGFGPQHLETLLSKCWTVGDQLRTEAKDGKSDLLAEAVTWLQMAAQIVEIMELRVGMNGLNSELKVAVFRSLRVCIS
ncbi:hypothetical protein BCR39DRAFT_535563 [Naematelia encephala]|uniref:Uncharacterized protein n=1 Tax=Naematelia encephala TaxID=71784 RepID=A0A1Y2B066_9TREE|nr:hypothetical protein BCR39DRAFT_535563 [Naematelia encephala]